MKSLSKIMLITFLLIGINQSKGIEPTWTLSVRNLTTVPNGEFQDSLLQFDVYLLWTNSGVSDPFNYSMTQLFWNYNTGISGGTLSISKLASNLPPDLQHTSFQVASGQFRVATNFPSNLNFIVSDVYPGTMIIRLQVRTSASIWNIVPLNLVWRTALPNFFTKVHYYNPNGIIVELTDRTSNLFFIETMTFLPVELASFFFTTNKNKVTLNWTTVRETNNKGFGVERKSVNSSDWMKVGFVHGNGTTSETRDYIFTESLNSGKYNYRLKQEDFNGNTEYFNLKNDVEVGIPERYILSQNYPNPFNPKTIINYSIPSSGKGQNSDVKLIVYNIIGEEIAVLVNAKQSPGMYRVEFDGSNFASGVYSYRLEASDPSASSGQGFVETKRMMLLK